MTVKMIEFFAKRPGMSLDDFRAHWLGTHAGVVLGLEGVERYTQNHLLPWSRDNLDLPFDGAVELWFESREVMKRNGKSTYWAELVADEERFIDRNDVTLMLVDEQVISPGSGQVKAILPVRRAAGADLNAFQAGLRDTLAPALSSIPGIGGLTLNTLKDGAYRSGQAVTWDALVLMWFDGLHPFEATTTGSAWRGVLADTGSLMDFPLPPAAFEEHLIRAD